MNDNSFGKYLKQERALAVEMWYFSNPDKGLGAPFLEIVDKRNGKIQQFVLNKEYTDKRFTTKGDIDGEYVDTKDYYQGKGFERMRLAEQGEELRD